MAPTSNNKNKKNTPSEVISTAILNGDTNTNGVGLPLTEDNNLSSFIVETAAEIDNQDPSSSSSKNSSKATTRARASSPIRRASPFKKKSSPVKMVFLDSESETDEIGGSALKMYYRSLNSVEHSTFLNFYRMNQKCMFYIQRFLDVNLTRYF